MFQKTIINYSFQIYNFLVIFFTTNPEYFGGVSRMKNPGISAGAINKRKDDERERSY
jgi:hypothetical protein